MQHSLEGSIRLSRREFLQVAGVGALSSAMVGALPLEASRAYAQGHWDGEADVLVVGTGAAGSAAAVAARHFGASVIMLEKAPVYGGTTAKSGGGAWIPNNPDMRAHGIPDPREDALRYMARYSYPHLYDPDTPWLGLPESEYRLIETFYDTASKAIEFLASVGALYMQAQIPGLPDYFEHAPENKAPRGRTMYPRPLSGGASGNGAEMIRQLRAWVERNGITVLTRHRVQRLVLNQRGEVVGLEASTGDNRVVAFRARKAVIFGSGGFTHNRELLLHYQPGPTYGGCAVPTNEGDFVYMAQAVGAKLGNMTGAWRAQVVLEQALEFSSVPNNVWQPPGDSMILVNKYGKRVVNEKRNYNDRTRVHFVWDPVNCEFPNQFLFMIYDQRCADVYAGRFPIPPAGSSAPWVISGQTLRELAANIDARLRRLRPRIGSYRLDPSFGSNLEETVQRFNEFAERGEDRDFGRGRYPYDVEWHRYVFSVPNEGTRWPLNDRPNITMFPISSTGPYYAVILAAGTLDTNGGPMINQLAQVLDTEGQPIPGLYGAGNCIASPSASAYWGGGSTLGPALTFGYIAGSNAVKEPVKEAAVTSRVSRPV